MLRVTFADIGALELQSALFKLSAYRRERLEQVRTELGKKQGAGAELLLCRALEELGLKTPPDIVADENGKPRLRGGELFFSLSHSGPWALCAVSDRELGADIQVRKPFNQRLARRFFAPDELELILSAPDRDRAFTEIWAKKESYIKALGLGLKLPLESFSVLSLPEPWGLWSRTEPGFCAAVCSAGPEEPEFFRETEASRLTFG